MFLMLCQFPASVFLNHFPKLFYSPDHKHPGVSEAVFCPIDMKLFQHVKDTFYGFITDGSRGVRVE